MTTQSLYETNTHWKEVPKTKRIFYELKLSPAMANSWAHHGVPGRHSSRFWANQHKESAAISPLLTLNTTPTNPNPNTTASVPYCQKGGGGVISAAFEGGGDVSVQNDWTKDGSHPGYSQCFCNNMKLDV